MRQGKHGRAAYRRLVLQGAPAAARELLGGVQRCRVHDAAQLVGACVALAEEIPPQVRHTPLLCV